MPTPTLRLTLDNTPQYGPISVRLPPEYHSIYRRLMEERMITHQGIESWINDISGRFESEIATSLILDAHHSQPSRRVNKRSG